VREEWACDNRAHGLSQIHNGISHTQLVATEGVPAIPPPDDIIALIATEVLPHEADVRHWLKRARFNGVEADDLIQEAYCRIFAATRAAPLTDGRAYFFTVVRNLAYEALRRSRVVVMERVSTIEAQAGTVDDLSPERVVIARQTLGTVQAAIGRLPKRCRDIFVLRRLNGLSQREIAHRLGISENVVEKEVAKGLRRVLEAVAIERAAAPAPGPRKNGLVRNRNETRQNQR
jgi:RNA polymerase sigma factor (sigma-70 family)